MQEDLNQLSRWSSEWGLRFNVSKCKVRHLEHNNPRRPYYIRDDLLEALSEEEDLGIVLDNELKFHSHTQAQVAKAKQALGLTK